MSILNKRSNVGDTERFGAHTRAAKAMCINLFAAHQPCAVVLPQRFLQGVCSEGRRRQRCADYRLRSEPRAP
ncbi:hypothetical protein PybrP1_005200, partial [[Pythium] brassicae (nom. inval.)]